jgi:hypothetical protein
LFKWRRGIIYAYSCIDVYADGATRDEWAYVGKTRQALYRRHEQHMADQPWADLFPQVRVIFEFDKCPDWWLSLAEKYTIWFTKPTYNYEFNLRNKYRIPIYQAKKDRSDRDRLARSRRRW